MSFSFNRAMFLTFLNRRYRGAQFSIVGLIFLSFYIYYYTTNDQIYQMTMRANNDRLSSSSSSSSSSDGRHLIRAILDTPTSGELRETSSSVVKTDPEVGNLPGSKDEGQSSPTSVPPSSITERLESSESKISQNDEKLVAEEEPSQPILSPSSEVLQSEKSGTEEETVPTDPSSSSKGAGENEKPAIKVNPAPPGLPSSSNVVEKAEKQPAPSSLKVVENAEKPANEEKPEPPSLPASSKIPENTGKPANEKKPESSASKVVENAEKPANEKKPEPPSPPASSNVAEKAEKPANEKQPAPSSSKVVENAGKPANEKKPEPPSPPAPSKVPENAGKPVSEKAPVPKKPTAPSSSNNQLASSPTEIIRKDKNEPAIPVVPTTSKIAGNTEKSTGEKLPDSETLKKNVTAPISKDWVAGIYKSGHSVSIPDKCPNSGAGVKLLIIIMTAPKNAEARKMIRLTWGHFGQRTDVKIAFLMGGNTTDKAIEEDIAREEETYDDMIRGNFVDSYSNLTLKVLSGLEWISDYCSGAKFVLKTDDDMFINVPLLLEFVDKHYKEDNVIFGRLAHGWKPDRNIKSKYYLPENEFGAKVLPEFTTGPAYLMSGDVVGKLYKTALEQRYIRLEDVFMTGVVAEKLGIKRVKAKEFVNQEVKSYTPCTVQQSISIHRVSYSDQFDLWKTLLDGLKKCI